MRPGKRKMGSVGAGALVLAGSSKRTGRRMPAQPGRRLAPPIQPRELGAMTLAFWFKVASLVVDTERWAFWRFILADAAVEYFEGKGCVLEVSSAPDGMAFNKAGVFHDVYLMVQLESTEGGGALSGCSEARKSQKGGWAIAVDDADARDRRGVVLPQTALLTPDLPAQRAGKLWRLAYSHDERGRLTETVARSMPQLLGIATAMGQE